MATGTAKLLSADDVRDLIRDEVKVHGSQRAVADAYGLQTSVVSQVLNGLRPPPQLLEAFGLEAIVYYSVRR